MLVGRDSIEESPKPAGSSQRLKLSNLTPRKSLSLPFGQDKLIEEIQKVNHNVAVVLLSGNAVLMPWLNKTKAVVQGWYLGSEAGNALADIGAESGRDK